MGEAEEDGKKEEAHNDEEGGVEAKEKKDKGDGEKKDKKSKKKKKSKDKDKDKDKVGKDKNDPAKLRAKLEKLEAKLDELLANQAKAPQDEADSKDAGFENMETEVQALVAKKEELLKLLNEDHQEGEGGKEKKEKEKEKEKEKKKKKKKDKKEKNPEDKKEPAKLRAKLGKIETQMQELATKKEQVTKLLHEVENSAEPPATSS